MVQVLCVALGSVLGGLLRWGVGLAFASWFGRDFPWGTFFINVSGSCFLGWFTTMLNGRFAASTWIDATNLRLAVAVGFTGAYTTFSTFELETNKLLQDGDTLPAMTYVVGSVFVGLLALRLGSWLAS